MQLPCKGCITYVICYSVYQRLSKQWDKTFAIRTMMSNCIYLKKYMVKKLEERLGQTNVMITDSAVAYYYRRSVFLEIPFQLGVRVEFHYNANK